MSKSPRLDRELRHAEERRIRSMMQDVAGGVLAGGDASGASADRRACEPGDLSQEEIDRALKELGSKPLTDADRELAAAGHAKVREALERGRAKLREPVPVLRRTSGKLRGRLHRDLQALTVLDGWACGECRAPLREGFGFFVNETREVATVKPGNGSPAKRTTPLGTPVDDGT
jgi:hypothetical protein